MSTPANLVSQIERCANRAGTPLPGPIAPALAAYLALLARWNRRINLTAHTIDPPSDEAIDHLIIEPLQAAQFVLPEERRALDVGSGGGSPAFPIALACPAMHLVLVESRTRKAAFLREVIRHLSLRNAEVENCRLEDFGDKPDFQPFDLATVRAVRLDQRSLASVARLMKPRARLFWFTTPSTSQVIDSGFLLESKTQLGTESRSSLAILRKA